MRLALTHANVIDCMDPAPIMDCTVLLEDGFIVGINRNGNPGDEWGHLINLDGAYLLPGLWDVHIHPEYVASPTPTVAQQTARFGEELSEGLTEAGVTSVRCGGAAHFMDVAWREAFAEGPVPGPRVFACGNFLTTTGGHFLTSGHARECDGPFSFVRAIREMIKNGVDHVKLNLSGGVMGPFWDRTTNTFLLPEELEAAFALCHQREYKVMAHATNPNAVKSALRLGAHSIEHGYVMDEECLQLFLERDAWYVPTLGITHLTPSQATSDREYRYVERRALAPDLVRRAEAAVDSHRTWFRQALRSGVKMALGSDVFPLRESALLEIGLWVKDGATPWEVLQAATTNAAQLCGRGDDLGTIEPGRLADLIAVDGNPLDDIENLGNLLLVIKEGKVVSDRRSPSPRRPG